MKTFSQIVIILLAIFNTELHAQSTFHVQQDTVTFTPAIGVSAAIEDRISTTTGTMTAVWKVEATDFPVDWINATCLCDNHGCYPCPMLWSPVTGTLSVKLSYPYDTVAGNFDMLIGFSDTNSSGCHFMTVRINNEAHTQDTAQETFMICNFPLGLNSVPEESVSVFPNPANAMLQINFPPQAVDRVIISGSSGKILATISATFNGKTQTDISTLPLGLYIIELVDKKNNILYVNKFIKQ